MASNTLTNTAQVRGAGVSEPQAVADLAACLGDPKALTKALPGALDAIVRAKIVTTVAGTLEVQALGAAWQNVRRNSEAVCSAFGLALQPQIQVLNDHAANVPAETIEATIGGLDPSQFDSWQKCTEAANQIDEVVKALVPLYRQPDDAQFSLEALRRIVLVDVPSDLDEATGWIWIHALTGRRSLGGSLGTARVDNSGTYFATVASIGGRFVWAGPAAIAKRVQTLKDATRKRTL